MIFREIFSKNNGLEWVYRIIMGEPGSSDNALIGEGKCFSEETAFVQSRGILREYRRLGDDVGQLSDPYSPREDELHFEHGGGSEVIISDEQTGEQLFVMEPDDLLRAVAFHYDLESGDDVLRALELFELERRGAIQTKGFMVDSDGEVKRPEPPICPTCGGKMYATCTCEGEVDPIADDKDWHVEPEVLEAWDQAVEETTGFLYLDDDDTLYGDRREI